MEQTLVGVNVMEEEKIVNQGDVIVHWNEQHEMRETLYDQSHMGDSCERRS